MLKRIFKAIKNWATNRTVLVSEDLSKSTLRNRQVDTPYGNITEAKTTLRTAASLDEHFLDDKTREEFHTDVRYWLKFNETLDMFDDRFKDFKLMKQYNNDILDKIRELSDCMSRPEEEMNKAICKKHSLTKLHKQTDRFLKSLRYDNPVEGNSFWDVITTTKPYDELALEFSQLDE